MKLLNKIKETIKGKKKTNFILGQGMLEDEKILLEFHLIKKISAAQIYAFKTDACIRFGEVDLYEKIIEKHNEDFSPDSFILMIYVGKYSDLKSKMDGFISNWNFALDENEPYKIK